MQLNDTLLGASNSDEDDRKDANAEEHAAQPEEDFICQTKHEYSIDDQHYMIDEKMSPVKGKEDIVAKFHLSPHSSSDHLGTSDQDVSVSYCLFQVRINFEILPSWVIYKY